MKNKIKQIMSYVFRLNESKINDHSSVDNIEMWDSLNHMNLILALEEEFKIEFENEEIIKMLDYRTIKKIIEEKLRV